MWSTKFQMLLLVQAMLLILLVGNCPANAEKDEPSDAEVPSTFEIELPRIEVQFMCGHDIRSTLNITDSFTQLYKTLLPDLQKVHLDYGKRIDGMKDIPETKWYYNQCNITSSQVLTTMEVQGVADFDISSNRTSVDHLFGGDTVKEFFQQEVCSDIDLFKVFFEKPKKPSLNPIEPTFEKVEHNMILLCEGADSAYYDENAPEPLFLFFGFFVGFFMVGQIFGELHRYDRRPHPLGSRRDRSSLNYSGIRMPDEIEMV